jgi:hypothetical protein
MKIKDALFGLPSRRQTSELSLQEQAKKQVALGIHTGS